MSRYPVRLVPQGAIPRAMEFGARLQRKPEPVEQQVEPACVREWIGWAITIDGEPISGLPVPFQNGTEDPVAIRVENLGGLCPDDCIEWDLRPVLDLTGVLGDDTTVTPDGCSAVDIGFGHTDLMRYQGLMVALFASVGGQPYGEAIVFVPQTTGGCVDERDVHEGWMFAIDGATPPGHGTVSPGEPVTFPNAAFTLDITDAAFADGDIDVCGSNLTAEITPSGGDPDAYADFMAGTWFDFSSGSVGARIWADGSHDYTGISLAIQVKWADTGALYGSPLFVSCA